MPQNKYKPISKERFKINDFEKSGLTTTDASNKRIESLDSKATTKWIKTCRPTLSATVLKSVDFCCYVIPYFDFNGDPLKIKESFFARARLEKLSDNIKIPGEKRPPKYLQPKDTGTPLYLLPDYDYRQAEKQKLPINIIEGEKKTMVAHKLGMRLPIGIAGVNNYGKDEELHPMFNNFDFKGRRVDLWFDSDTLERGDLFDAAEKLAWLLGDRGALPYLRVIPTLKGQDKTGLDDYFISLLTKTKVRVTKEIRKKIQLIPVRDLSTQERTARELHNSEDEPDKLFIPGLFGEGLTGLSAPPKRGKSSLVHEMMLGLAASEYGKFKICDYWESKGTYKVLYCAPEDRWGVLKERQSEIVKRVATNPKTGKINQRKVDAIINENIIYSRNLTRRIKESKYPMKALRNAIDKYKPDIVVIDTLNHIRPKQKQKGQSVYDFEYQWMSDLRQTCETKNVSMVVVHHFAKTQYGSPSEQVGGTAGMSGGMENLILIKNPGANQVHDEIVVLARTFSAEDTFVARYDKESKTYSILGTTDEFPNNQIDIDIINELIQSPEGATPTQIAEATGIKVDTVKPKIIALKNRELVFSNGAGVYFKCQEDLYRSIKKNKEKSPSEKQITNDRSKIRRNN